MLKAMLSCIAFVRDCIQLKTESRFYPEFSHNLILVKILKLFRLYNFM